MNQSYQEELNRDYRAIPVSTFSNKRPLVRDLGAALERIVFKNTKDLFQPSVQSENVKVENEACWWTPPQNWLLVEFCQSSTIHGLFFIGKSRLHLSERIFWTIAFILGVVASLLLIYEVWDRYNKKPVIVSFQPAEVDIDSLSFPAVSLCSINAFPKSKVKLLQKAAKERGPYSKLAKDLLKFVRSVCNSQRSFAKEFHFAYSRGEDGSDTGWNETITEDDQDEMIDFLLEHTMPCGDLIRLCILGEEKVDCRKIFKPIITNYAKCCSFNILPLPLLLNNPRSVSGKEGENHSSQNPALGTKKRWSDEEIQEWRLWDYDKDGFIFKNKSLAQPFRQKRAGLLYGLSILVDPNIHESYCPVSDSEGFRLLLHSPLDMPHINEFASFVQLNKELLIEVHPELTNADDDIRQFEMKDRNCYFPEERQLKFFGPYTGGNCVDECTSLVLEKRCNCTYFFMPRGENMNICNTDDESKDMKCIGSAKVDLLETLKTECAYCSSLCENMEYKYESTMSTLQNSSLLWEDPDPRNHTHGVPSWAKNRMSIMHIFIGSDTIVPKLRKRMHGTTDLIANTGGLLGLCLGFSVLSAIELVYFITLRAFWKFCRKQKKSSCSGHTFLDNEQGRQERVIHLKSSQIPLLSALPPNHNNVPPVFVEHGNHRKLL